MTMPDENSATRLRQAPQVPQQTQNTASVPQSAATPVSHIPVPIVSQGNHDVDDKHSIGGLLMIGAGLVLALVIAVFLIWFVLSKFIPSGSKAVTLEYWGLWEDTSTMQSIIADFERKNPTITVHYVKEDPKQYIDRLLARMQQGNGPDVFRFHNSWIHILLPMLAPLPQTVVSSQDFAKLYYPVTQQDLVRNGAIYGIPLDMDTLSLFTNNQLLQKENITIPTNWPDFITDARALTVKDANGKIKVAGTALGTYDNITHAPDIISLLFAQNGADTLNLATTSKNASDAIAFFTSFVKEDGNVWDDTLDPSFIAFAKGNLGMYFGYSWDIFNLKTYNPSLDFTVSAVPHLPGRDITVASYWVEGVSAKSSHQKEAMLFMRYLAQKDVQQKLFSEEAKTRLFGEPYARTDLADTIKDNPMLSPFIDQAPHAVSSIFAGDTGNTRFNERLNQFLERAVGDIFQDTSPDTAISNISQGVSLVLSEYDTTGKTGNH